MLNWTPWVHYNFNENGSSIQYKYFCIKKEYSVETMNKLWKKWYTHIINPYKIYKLSKISIFNVQINNLPSL